MQALGMVVALVVLVLGTIVPFMKRDPLLPEVISRHGATIDSQIYLTMYITGAIFAAAQLALAWIVWKYRNQGQKAQYLHGNMLVEYGSIVGSLVLFLGLNLMGQGVWADMHLKEKPRGDQVVHFEVQGRTFKWYFRYPGTDKTFGTSKVELSVDDVNNYFGLDYSGDKDTHDDIVEGTLKLPYDRDAVARIRARDVIHSFFVRELRVKQDAVPGLEVQVPFHVSKAGMKKGSGPLTGVNAAALNAKDTGAVIRAFQQIGLTLSDKMEIFTCEENFLAEMNKVVGKDEDLSKILEKAKPEIAEKLANRWVVKDRSKSHYDQSPAAAGYPLNYAIEQEGEQLNVYKINYEVICAELCGQGHWNMRSELEIVSPEEYALWYRIKSEFAKAYR